MNKLLCPRHKKLSCSRLQHREWHSVGFFNCLNLRGPSITSTWEWLCLLDAVLLAQLSHLPSLSSAWRLACLLSPREEVRASHTGPHHYDVTGCFLLFAWHFLSFGSCFFGSNLCFQAFVLLGNILEAQSWGSARFSHPLCTFPRGRVTLFPVGAVCRWHALVLQCAPIQWWLLGSLCIFCQSSLTTYWRFPRIFLDSLHLKSGFFTVYSREWKRMSVEEMA